MTTQPIFRMFERNAATKRNRKLNLQLFAEGEGTDGAGTPEGESGGQPEGQDDLDALRVQLAQANAENAKLKNKCDTLASENAAKTKQLREKMTAQEQEEEAKREAEAAKEKRFKEMEHKFLVTEATNTYMDVLEMSKEIAQQYAEARVDGDSDKENDILRQHMKAFKANMLQSFLKERGEVNAGHGDSSGESEAVKFAKSLPKFETSVNEDLLKAYM